MNLSVQALRHNQWQSQPSYSLVHCASTEHPIAHWTIRKTLPMRAPAQAFVQQRNRSFTGLRLSFIKTTVSRGKYMSFRKHEMYGFALILCFRALYLIAFRTLYTSDRPSIHLRPTCLYISIYIQPACRTSRPTYFIGGAVRRRILIEKCSPHCEMLFHTHETIHEIIILYILIFMVFYSK